MIRARHLGAALVLASLVVRTGANERGCHTKEDSSGATPAPKSSGSRAAFVVHCEAPSHPISPLVYGISLRPAHDTPAEWQLGATARRWGGNHTSRYNWKHGNAWNTGKDWYFMNVGSESEARPAYRRFIDDDVAHAMSTAITVPTIGWVAKDTSSYGFSVKLFGPQRGTAPGKSDVGDGVAANGTLLAPGSPERTSVAMSPSSIGEWVTAIRASDRTNGGRSVSMYILDNEPTLWNETHRDVHPDPLSYDELLQRTTAYAKEIRRADPDATIAGPALWGWSAYFESAVDHANASKPDRAAHGGVALLPWWLREVRAEEKRSDTRLLDLVDVHFYPQGKGIGVGVTGDTDPDTAARRIRSTRALWDPTYVDESWIAEPVRLVPRLRSWIDENAPGVGISIGEYNFGAENHMSGGLAVAEALGRFGQLGVTSAFYWDYPPAGSPAFWAFRAFRNFDDRGARFLDFSVPIDVAQSGTSAFASRDAKGEHVVVVLLNFDPLASSAKTLDASSCGRVAAMRELVYATGAAGFVPATSSSLPPYSISVVDLTIAEEAATPP